MNQMRIAAHITFAAIVLTTALLSCTDVNVSRQDVDVPIRFDVVAKPNTRASSAETVLPLTVRAESADASFYKLLTVSEVSPDGICFPGEEVFWPSGNKPVRFDAVSPSSVNALYQGSENVRIDNFDSSSGVDLWVCSISRSLRDDASKGLVPLELVRPTSLVKFYVVSKLEEGFTLRIRSVRLSGVATRGNLEFSPEGNATSVRWSSLSGGDSAIEALEKAVEIEPDEGPSYIPADLNTIPQRGVTMTLSVLCDIIGPNSTLSGQILSGTKTVNWRASKIHEYLLRFSSDLSLTINDYYDSQ